MKKITLFLVFVGMMMLQSCEVTEVTEITEVVENNTISEVFEETISFTSNNNYKVTFPLQPKIFSGDNILVYELVNTNNGIDTWALLPQLYYFAGGSAQYNFNFSLDRFTIFVDASFPLEQLQPSFRLNKTFRIVIIAGDDGINSGGPNSRSINNKADFSDYHAVIKRFKINDTNVKTNR
ncbi:hypothetical protein SAMN05444372_11215 [Flavobacterium micromati]|uniref:Uncharacterized protein n=1 Tax=Flavobacterium micromati TaxID=229205 RepID=A0A1M5P061_9FLAO|nr:hypothetical protein [Flavobacterium micromati]SHG95214.1 hypothetical protein SAMN05444372_11215 [Flavobacterium micromati]